jgi:hypothetical protein
MALKIAISTAAQTGVGFKPMGFPLPEAYIKVTALLWDGVPPTIEVAKPTGEYGAPPKLTGTVRVTAGLWANKDARDTDAAPLGSQVYVIHNPDFAQDLLAQAYGVIKSANEMCGLALDTTVDA